MRLRSRTVLAAVAAACAIGLAAWQLSRVCGSRDLPGGEVALEVWLEEGPATAELSAEVHALRREAAATVRELLKRYPHRAESFDVVALWHLRLGRTDQAVACWQHALELDPQFGHAYRALGQIARQQAQYDRAVELLHQAAAADPSAAPDISVELVDVLTKAGRFDEAQQAAEKSLADDPAFLPSLFQLGGILMERHQYKEARQVLERAIAVGPNFSPAYGLLINACRRLGDEASARAYREILDGLRAKDRLLPQKPPSDSEEVRQVVAEICTAAARAYVQFGDPSAGESLLQRARALAPGYLPSAQALAWLYQEQGRLETALELLRALHHEQPEDLQTCVALGALCVRLGRLEEAEKACKAALALAPARAEAHAALADVYLRSGQNLAAARQAAARAVELRPAAPFYYLLSLACQRSGDLAAARSAIREALRRDPANPRYRQLQASLEP